MDVPCSLLLPPLNELLLLNERKKKNNKVYTSPLASALIESPEMGSTTLSLSLELELELDLATATALISATASNKIK